MSERTFQIMRLYPERNYPKQINSIPWSLIEPHGEQAKINHQQSLERLNQRGGLSPMEAVAVLEDADYRKRWPEKVDRDAQASEAIYRLKELCSKAETSNNPSEPPARSSALLGPAADVEGVGDPEPKLGLVRIDGV